METYGMLDNIKAHSVMVEKIALLIARGLLDAGETISLGKVTAGALMHDIAKTHCLESGEDHSAKGKTICLENHLDEIADIVAEHVIMKNYEPLGPITEKEIIYYADKRVNHDAVVSIEERLAYLLERYGNGRERIRQAIMRNFSICKEVEKRLFSKLNFGPEDLPAVLESK